MDIDWSQVKKSTLWHYEDLIKKLLEVLDYDFVREKYNHTMADAVIFSERIQQGYVANGKEAIFISKIRAHLQVLDRVLGFVRKLQADIYNRPIYRTLTTEAAATGAALLAGIGVGIYPDARTAVYRVVRWHDSVVYPDPQRVAVYEKTYALFSQLYPSLVEHFHILSYLYPIILSFL